MTACWEENPKNLAQSSIYCGYGKGFEEVCTTQENVQQVPELVSSLILDVNAAVDKLGAAVNKATNSLGYPNLNNISKKASNNYPRFAEE